MKRLPRGLNSARPTHRKSHVYQIERHALEKLGLVRQLCCGERAACVGRLGIGEGLGVKGKHVAEDGHGRAVVATFGQVYAVVLQD